MVKNLEGAIIGSIKTFDDKQWQEYNKDNKNLRTVE